jgi:hypothetical protein
MVMHKHVDRHTAGPTEQECWDDFWAPICAPDGELDLEQVKKELFDCHGMIQEIPKVFDHVTGGRISKPNTMAFEVIAMADEHYEEIAAEDLREQLGWLAWTLNQIATMSSERAITIEEFDKYIDGTLGEIENDYEIAFGIAQILARETLTDELRELGEATHTAALKLVAAAAQRARHDG